MTANQNPLQITRMNGHGHEVYGRRLIVTYFS